MKKTFLPLLTLTFFLTPILNVEAQQASTGFSLSTPFGGPISSLIQCTCSGNYIISVNDVFSHSIKNILVFPPISRLFESFMFFPGQNVLGTYTPGPQCIVLEDGFCVVLPTHGVIDSSPGAGSSGPAIASSLGIDKAGSGIADAAKGAATMFGSLGKNVGGALLKAGISLGQQEISKLLRPGNSLSSNNKKPKQSVRTEAKNHFVADEAKFNRNKISPILDRNGNIIARADSQFVSGGEKGTLKHEKTGILTDGTVVVYDTTVGGIPRYFILEEGAGIGENGILLEPFRSIAVNPNSIPIGSLVDIPETRGMILPDGTTHNGIWRADEIDNNLKRFEVSFFIGTEGNRVFLKAAGISNQEKLTIIILQ